MAIHKCSSSYSDEDYIGIELFSSPNFFCYSITNSPSPSRDFEFQMCQFPLDKLPKTSPADELFCNGKLLPLHLRPRSQSLQNLFNYTLPPTLSSLSEFPTEDSVGNQNHCFFQLHSIIGYHPLKKYNWSGKLKQILLGQKLKASTSFLKSFFTKSGDEFSCTKTAASSTVQPEKGGQEDHFEDLKYMKISKKSPFGENAERKRRHSLASSSSSSSSSSRSSSGSSNSTFSISSSNDLQLVKTTSMMSTSKNNNFEIEKSIEGAIAYCKKSYEQQQQQQQQKLICAAEFDVCSMPVSAVVTCGDY